MANYLSKHTESHTHTHAHTNTRAFTHSVAAAEIARCTVGRSDRLDERFAESTTRLDTVFAATAQSRREDCGLPGERTRARELVDVENGVQTESQEPSRGKGRR